MRESPLQESCTFKFSLHMTVWTRHTEQGSDTFILNSINPPEELHLLKFTEAGL